MVFILGILSAFQATLTLPGIAGIVLTIGMAVDANVLIFERIREEQSTGKTLKAAIDGNASDPWWVEKGRHSIKNIFEDSSRVETFITASLPTDKTAATQADKDRAAYIKLSDEIMGRTDAG